MVYFDNTGVACLDVVIGMYTTLCSNDELLGLFSIYIKNVNIFLFGCDGFSRMSETYNVYTVELQWLEHLWDHEN